MAKDPRLERVGVSGVHIVDCPNCGEERTYRRKTLATKAVRLGTICKSCSSKRNFKKYNGEVQEEFGVRLSWLKTYETGAKARGLCFDITAKDVRELMDIQDGLCALSGQPIRFPLSSKFSTVTASIDRIDNSKGYTKDNIQLVHKKINMLRGKLGVEEFVDLCKMVAEYN
jgi:hypothetical protein